MQVTDASYYDRGLLSTHGMRKSACFIGCLMLALQEWIRLLLRIDEYIRVYNSSEARIITILYSLQFFKYLLTLEISPKLEPLHLPPFQYS
jgi:hypothetical protein